MPETGKILVIDDEAQVTSVLDRFLTRLGFTVITADSGRQGLERVERDRPDVVLLDIRMPGMDGLDVLRRIKAKHVDVAVIMITGARDTALASASLAIGASDYITKPIDFAYLERAVREQFPSPPSAPAEPVGETEPAPAVESVPTADLEVELAQITQELTAPAPVAAPSDLPTVPSVERAPVVALAAECFRLAGGVATARLAQEIEESTVALLRAVATRTDLHRSSKRLRLCLRVVRALGSLSGEELGRFEALCQQVEAGS